MTKRALALFAAGAMAAAAGCSGSVDAGGEMPSSIDQAYGNGIVTQKGDLPYDVAQSGVAVRAAELDGWTFAVVAGGEVRVTVGSDDGHVVPRLYLYGVATPDGTRYELEHAFGSPSSPAVIDATLQLDGTYEVVVSSHASMRGSYTIALACVNGQCGNAPPSPQTFAETRIAQADIDAGKYTAAALFDVGDFLFQHQFTLDEGLGNALAGAPGGTRSRPNERRVQYATFGGRDGDACVSCHDVGGDDGGGSLAALVAAEGDGNDAATALLRDGIQVIGDGALQQLAIEMTNELQGELADARTQAALTHMGVTVKLTTKGVDFGSAIVTPDGHVDDTNLVGIEHDLVVRPFGWKGAAPNLRRFIEGALQTHHGMQAETLIAANCATPIPGRVGNGPDCHDPDGDGVRDEIVEGQLTALAVYAALLEVPVQTFPTDAAEKQRALAGQALFTAVGCADCHRPTLTLDDPRHAELPDLTGGAPFVFDLTRDGKSPRLGFDVNGKVQVALFSDLKRHDMGASNADVHDTHGVGTVVDARQFLTRPLWGVAVTAPYLHDGRAPTLRDAILGHDGEAAGARASFVALAADDHAEVIEFLQTLTRAP